MKQLLKKFDFEPLRVFNISFTPSIFKEASSCQ